MEQKIFFITKYFFKKYQGGVLKGPPSDKIFEKIFTKNFFVKFFY